MTPSNQPAKYNLLDSSRELFKKLAFDFEEFKKEPYSTYKAMDCAATAWHLVDWVWKEYESQESLDSLRNRFYLVCDDLKVMHDIANGSKHLTLTRNKSDMVGSDIENDYCEQGYVEPGYFNDELLIQFKDGSRRSMLVLLNSVLNFWESYFSNKY